MNRNKHVKVRFVVQTNKHQECREPTFLLPSDDIACYRSSLTSWPALLSHSWVLSYLSCSAVFSGVILHVLNVFSVCFPKCVSACVYKQALTFFKMFVWIIYCYACVFSVCSGHNLGYTVCMNICRSVRCECRGCVNQGFHSVSCEAPFIHQWLLFVICTAWCCYCLCHTTN